MRIGITCDLRDEYLAAGYTEEETAEFDRPDTVDALEGALRELGHDVDRVGNVRALIGRLAAGDRWDLVFNIAEGLRGAGREAQVPAVLEAYDIPCTFSDSVACALTHHKAFAKGVLRDRGLPSPEFAVVADERDLAEVRLQPPLFVKPLAEGTGKGVTPASRVEDAAALARVTRELWARFDQPVLVERYLPGREVTVGILGTGREARSLGALEIVLLGDAEPGVYSYVNKERCEELVEYRFVDDAFAHRAAELAVAAWRALGCRDAGRVDLRADENGDPQILELNPLAGLHPEHSDLPILCTQRGVSYVQLIAGIVDSALRRVRV